MYIMYNISNLIMCVYMCVFFFKGGRSLNHSFNPFSHHSFHVQGKEQTAQQ